MTAKKTTKRTASKAKKKVDTDIPPGPPETSQKQAGIYRIDVEPTQDVPKPPREGSKRRAVLDLLLSEQGGTIEEVMAVTEQEPFKSMNTGPWNRRTAQEGIRLLNKQNGYGLRTDAEGRIHAYSREATAKKSA